MIGVTIKANTGDFKQSSEEIFKCISEPYTSVNEHGFESAFVCAVNIKDDTVRQIPVDNIISALYIPK